MKDKIIKVDRNKYKNIVKAILIFLLFIYIEYVELIPIYIFKVKDFTGSTMVLFSLFKNIILMFLLFLIYRKDLIKDWDTFRSNIGDNMDIGIKYWFVGLICMIISNTVINLVFRTGGPGNEQAVQTYITYSPFIMLINAGIVAPFTEEIIFRKTLNDCINNKWIFACLSGFIFGLMHILGTYENIVDCLYIIPYGMLGFSFALAYKESDTFYTSFTIHMMHNIILIVSAIVFNII